MAPLFRFSIALVLGLALLAFAAAVVVNDVTRGWFERDISLRARLAVSSARTALILHWHEDPGAIRAVLNDLTRDERMMAAAACSVDAGLIAATDDYPAQVSCSDIAARLQPEQAGPDEPWQEFDRRIDLPSGPAYISAIPVMNGARPLGFVVLVQDMSYAEKREARVQRLILAAFGILAILAALLTGVAARLAWRGWTTEVLRFIRGGKHRRAFQPIVRDVRELIERISAERALDAEGGAWTPQRLKHTLTQYLHGEKIVMLANREPYIHERTADGTVRVVHPASGLVTAMEPVMRACGGVWVAHGSGSADRETVDRDGHVRVPPGEGSYVLRRVWLSSEQEKGYYYGFANEGLWPLCHIADARPSFRHADWDHYQEVNRLFADTVCNEADSEDPIIFVQDYHFALAPRMIRARLPQATIIAFWHIPWPNSERFGICPWGEQLLQGLLGSSIIGFHTQLHCNNFFDAADRFLEARIDRERFAVYQMGRPTLVRPYPISIEWPSAWVKALPSPAECRASLFAELGLPPDALLGVGVDRLDYTKGIEERLLAVERLLERSPEFVGRFRFLQLAAPSRTIIERYRLLNESVEAIAARINARFGSGAYKPIILLRAHHEPLAVFRAYRAADLCYVSSLHDGMNLVAKEFVSARDDERGVLILSHFTGASRELTEALIVNPYDLDEASDALLTALRMPPPEQRARMQAMRAIVAQFNVYRWAGRMLIDAANVRAKERLQRRDDAERAVRAS